MTSSLQNPIIEQKCIWLEFAADKSRTVTNNNKSFKTEIYFNYQRKRVQIVSFYLP